MLTFILSVHRAREPPPQVSVGNFTYLLPVAERKRWEKRGNVPHREDSTSDQGFHALGNSGGVMQPYGRQIRFFCTSLTFGSSASRKNLLTPSTVGQGVSTEAQLRCKTTPSNNNPIGLNTADLRRPSSGSIISSSSIDGTSSFLGTSGSVEGHVPHMICKFFFSCHLFLLRPHFNP